MKEILFCHISKEKPNASALGAFNQALSSGATMAEAKKAASEAVKSDDTITDVKRYGADSNVFQPWNKIPSYNRSTYGGVRRVMVLDRMTGATVLAPWRGPGARKRKK